ncbi:hypothetical protein PMI42_04820 [Bradyrhizobium sp. YR681]|uniref:hypothetical protein n=1 Tax=Bradyrhizobium sp. YR681 TaxID=1144344 RepID=UPI0002710D1A|nr:hypothetical protein [Bradyrhizobium sp. YR681]EJN11806.1 hypothetical protein PMI42_04820 [Bradyrhizobium sp. YR681]
MIRIIDILAALLPVILIVIALLLVCAVRIVRRGAASRSSLSAAADDPFFFPFGEVPTLPRERQMVARDFRAWGIPLRTKPSAGALRRNENGGRPSSLSRTAVVLTFRKRGA